ncbi:MAG: alpha/beta hydrolase [Clostridia bacterium]|nr:alpha/beta hydrolase [Clostridia bacterium]
MDKIYLWEKGKTPYFNPEYGQEEPNLTPYLINDGKKRGAVIVAPGGAYTHKAYQHEGYDVAEKLNSFGINAFVIDYRVAPYQYPAITGDILRAIRYVRYHAEEMNIDPTKIGVLGFSSGGHLCNSAMCAFDYGKDGDEIDKVSSRPDAVVLCYPVITLVEDYMHRYSRTQLLGGLPDEEKLAYSLSGEKAVKEDTPPCFIWHTQDDDGVSVWNSLNLYSSLVKNNIPSELHVFPHGEHGLGMAPDRNDVSQWTSLLSTWLTNLGFN